MASSAFGNIATGKLLRQFPAQPGDVLAIAFSADGKTLAAGSWLTVRFWEVFSGRERGRLDGQQGDVRSVAFSPDGKTLPPVRAERPSSSGM